MDKLTDLLKDANMAYYMGEPFMSDREFDKLAKIANYKDVGTMGGRIEHLFPMYSLQKVFENEHAEKNPLAEYSGKTIWTPKLDGAAVSLTYCRGDFIKGVTRGDGKKGLDITENIKNIIPLEYDFNKVHQCITTPRPYSQITGEVVAPKSIKNSRNYAAGALNLKDSNEFKERDLTFVVYGIQPANELNWSEEMENLNTAGFNTIIDSEWHEFPTDGMVCRIDNQIDFDKMGYTSHHPKAAYALKRIQKGVETKLVDVIWNVGKSGVVAPVGILEPVDIDGANVSKATLHNMAYINNLNLEIGCKVEVIRSGEIIPRIVRRVY
jgi:DNA ligase (NAD+)